MVKRWITLLLLVVTFLPLGACGSEKIELAPESALPPAIRQAPVNVREAYRFALANQEVLSKIPCYCGCGGGHSGESPHNSVKDCFVREVRPDGTIIWDDMGLG